MSKHSFTKKVGIGSSEQDFVGLCIIILCTSPSDTVAKVLKSGAITFGLAIEVGEKSGNAERILDIFQ